jgi:SAM-dependent methyltransferase
MQYDPIKRSLGEVFNKTPFLRKLFYRLLDLLLLRAWHIHLELKKWGKQAPAQPMILDAGMGFGQYSWYMSQLWPSCDITAIDVKEEQVADCNGFFKQAGVSRRVRCEVGDLTVYVKPEHYHLVLCVDVMEHILEDELVFRNYAASLKKGGMLLISTPSDQGGSDVHGEGEASFIEEHVRDGYNLKDIEQKLLRNGFSKAEARYSYGSPGKIAWRLSMKYPIQMLGVSKLFFIILPLYYLLVYPFAFVLNYFDAHGNHPTGTGLIVKAWK